ncbi:uncharacterized protein LOC110824251 isoform X3 [Carica papaya]|uniref:uncharacterized protein LOC110824251 isoform X3 n=1 Tax=Carica papaya TaxID=3649 RepID=UPI000B8CEB6C|nr:uncharacterized protein LOC110824251 isoform X3 [Carica papaya]
MATTPIHFCSVLSESKRIINAHSRHFLALSVLFLLPLSFSLTVYPALHRLFDQSTMNNTLALLVYVPPHPLRDPPAISTETIVFPLLYILSVLFFCLWAVGSITYSVFQGFYGRPVKLVSAIKSGFASFLPLWITTIVSGVIVSGIFLIFGLFLFLVNKGAELVGFQIIYSSPYFIGFSMVLLCALVLVLVCLQLNWCLVSVVTVVESTWGFQPLKRSTSLIKGMRKVALSLFLFFGFASGLLLWSSSVSAVNLGVADDRWWTSWAFVVHIVVTSAFLMLLMLYNIAANTVLYMHCKAIHGELAGEIAEEFAREYVHLPFEDDISWCAYICMHKCRSWSPN